MTTEFVILLVLLIVTWIVLLLVYQRNETNNTNNNSTPHILSVQGTGTAQGTPDNLVISMGAENQGKTAAEAWNGLSTKVNEWTNYLINEAKIPKEDITTVNTIVQPIYSNSLPNNNSQNNPPQIIGYLASYNLEVLLKEDQQEKAGTILDNSSRILQDAYRLQNIQHVASEKKRNELMAIARKRAVDSAMNKANQLSIDSSVSLGPIINIEESPSPSYLKTFNVASAAPSSSDTTITLLPGQISVQVDVRLVYSL